MSYATLLTNGQVIQTKINRLNTEIIELTNIMDKLDLTVIYRTFHPNTKKYSFLSIFS